jgi:peptide/nickel transport system substrate-binding protein
VVIHPALFEEEHSTMSDIRGLLDELAAGELNRRQVLARATALGVSAASMTAFLQHPAVLAQATPEAVPVTGGRPDAGTEGQVRGEGGELRILVPQGASGLSVHNATGGKDIAAGMIISEPLLAYAADTSLVPVLVKEVPTIENGLLAADLSTVTFNLLEDVVWSDGEPFTADDVVFSWEWNVDQSNGSIDSVSWQLLSNVEAIDDYTVQATFAAPTIGWFQPFGSNIGAIYPQHFWEGRDAAEANEAFLLSPIGTGPFVLEELSPNDQVIYSVNESYREPNKPFFSRVILKGGGDAASAVLAVTQTGDWDLAFTLQIDRQALEGALGDKGAVYGPPGTGVEKIQFNFSDPNAEVDGQRSQKDTPHPFLTDIAVREAISLGIDRELISEQLYSGSPSEPAGRNLLAGMAIYESPNTTWEYNPEKAAQILEDAGYVLNGSIREKDGVPLRLRYVTTTAPVRVKVQQVVKASLAELGFDVELVQVDGSIFFDSGNEQSFTRFYSDMQEYTDGATSAFPINYMKYWYAGPDGENMAQLENNYTGTNKTRYSNAEYDELWEQIGAVASEQEAIDLFIALNDHVVENFVEIPIVQLVADRFAARNDFNVDNIAVTAFGDTYWNIANWNNLPES